VHDEDLTDIKEDLVLLTMAEVLDPTVSQDQKTTTRSLKRPLETLVVSMGKRQKMNIKARKTKAQAYPQNTKI
jgi:hypothetical protein